MMAASSASDGLDPGIIVDARYRIQQEIGQGNMATVYLATDELTGREVALKVMRERLAGRPDRVQRFLKEHELGSEVGRHENIVATLDHGRVGGHEGTPYLVMELIVGPSLDLMLAMHQRLEARRAISIAMGIAKGLDAIHRAGVVHRDVKPSNVLVAQLEGEVEVAKLLDFGLAIRAQTSQAGDLRARLTLFTQIPGSAGYMAPEVVARVEPHPSADVFGFGILLVELLTGRHPFDGLDRDNYLSEITRSDWSLAQAVVDEIEVPEARALVVACTQRRPDDRPSMAEVISSLNTLLGPSLTSVDSMAATHPRGQRAELDERTGAAASLAKGWRWTALPVLLVASVGLGVALQDTPGPRSPSLEEHRSRSASLATVAVEENGVGERGTSSGQPSSQATDGDTASYEGAPTALTEEPSPIAVEAVSATTAEEASTPMSEEISTLAVEATSATAAEGSPPERRSRRKKRGQARAPRERRDSSRDKPVPSSSSQAVPPRVTAECKLLHDSIASMRAEGGWSRILFLIKANRGCFNRAEYRRLRIEALARTGKHEECVKAGAGSHDPEIEAWVDKCKRNEP